MAEHDRETHQVAQGPNFALEPVRARPICRRWNGETYPGDFGSGLGGNFPRNVWQLSPERARTLGRHLFEPRSGHAALLAGRIRDQRRRSTLATSWQTFDGQGWSANIGVRFVQTKEHVLVNVADPRRCVSGAETLQRARRDHDVRVRLVLPVRRSSTPYNDVLPSANLRWDVARDVVAALRDREARWRVPTTARSAARSRRTTRRTRATAATPTSKPIRSTNVDGTLEWYFQPRALLAADLFYMDLDNYVGFGVHDVRCSTSARERSTPTQISSPTNSSGKVKGVELA